MYEHAIHLHVYINIYIYIYMSYETVGYSKQYQLHPTRIVHIKLKILFF